MELSYKYSYMGSTILITVFYLPILPLSCVFSFFGLFLMYFIEKYNVLNVYKRPEKIDGRITRTYVDFFRLTIFVYALSNYIFNGQISYGNASFDLIALILFASLIIVPVGYLLRKLRFIEEFDLANDDYEDLYFELGINYEMSNPITKEKGFEKYLCSLYEKGLITDKEYQENSKKIKTAPSDIIELYYQKKYGKLIEKNAKKKLISGLKKHDNYSNDPKNKGTGFIKNIKGGKSKGLQSLLLNKKTSRQSKVHNANPEPSKKGFMNMFVPLNVDNQKNNEDNLQNPLLKNARVGSSLTGRNLVNNKSDDNSNNDKKMPSDD